MRYLAQLNEFLLHVLNGLSFASLLFILASGMSLIVGVMGIINLAHGSLYMIGIYAGLAVFPYVGNFVISALAGGIAAGLAGLLIERTCLSRLYRQTADQCLVTIGFLYIFQNLIRWIWGSVPKMGVEPSAFSGSVAVGNMFFPTYRFALIVVGILMFLGLWLLVSKTRVGAIVRAGMDDKETVLTLGINYALVCSIVFLLGATIAGFAGFIGGPMMGAEPEMGFPILLLSFVVIVLGGMGSVPGALLGAIFIGLIDAFGKAFFPELAMFTLYFIAIVILLVRPSGILGRRTV